MSSSLCDHNLIRYTAVSRFSPSGMVDTFADLPALNIFHRLCFPAQKFIRSHFSEQILFSLIICKSRMKWRHLALALLMISLSPVPSNITTHHHIWQNGHSCRSLLSCSVSLSLCGVTHLRRIIRLISILMNSIILKEELNTVN